MTTTATAIASPPDPDRRKPVTREYHGREWQVLTPDGDPDALQAQRIEQLGREINFNLRDLVADDDAYERALVALSFVLGFDRLVGAPPLDAHRPTEADHEA